MTPRNLEIGSVEMSPSVSTTSIDSHRKLDVNPSIPETRHTVNDENYFWTDKYKELRKDFSPEQIAWFDKNVTEEEDFKNLRFAFKKGFIAWEEGEMIFIPDNLKNHTFLSGTPISKTRLLETLVKLGLVQEENKEEILKSSIRVNWVEKDVFLPDSLEELFQGKSNSGQNVGRKRELGGISWLSRVTLADGTVTTPIEIYVAKEMKDLGVERIGDSLTYLDKESGQRTRFSLSKINPDTRSDLGELAVMGLPNLYNRVLFDEDLGLKTGPNTRQLSFKRKSKHVGLHNGYTSQRYYVGGQENVFGTESQEDDRYVVLDRWTGGYFRKVNGNLRLHSTFPLAGAEDFAEVKKKVAQDLGKEVTEVTGKEMATSKYAVTRVQREEVKAYSPTDYISQYQNEPTNEYVDRILKYSDAVAVINAVNRLFVQADLPSLDFPWSKKIRLVEVVANLEEETLVEYARNYGIEGLMVLLAAEADKAWPQKCLSLAQKYTDDHHEKEFKKILSEHAPLVSDEDEFKRLLEDTTSNPDVLGYLSDLRRDSLSSITRSIESNATSTSKDVGGLSVDIHAKLITFKALKERDLLDNLEEIKNSELEIKKGGEVSSEDYEEMRFVYSNNQAEVGAHDEILAHFDERVQDPNTRFYIFKWQGKIQSFTAFSRKMDKVLEATSFNVRTEARGFKIGEAMLEEAIANEAKENILYAECYANLPITSKYIETGWVAERHFEEKGKVAGSVDQLFEIYRDDKESASFWGKQQTSIEDIIAMKDLPEGVRVEFSGSQLGLPHYLLNQGYVLTRLFHYKPDGKFYGVYEPKIEDKTVRQRIEEATASADTVA